MSQPTDGTSATETPAPGVLATLAAASFMLFAAALPWSIATQSVSVALLAAATILLVASGRARWPHTPVNLPALLWMAAMLIAALWAEDRGGSLVRLKKALFPALVPLVALHAARPRDGRRALLVLLLSAGAASLLGLGVFAWKGAGAAARARGPVGHYMTFAGGLLLLVSAALGVAGATRARRPRILAAVFVLLGLAALAATFTRSSWIGLGVSMAVITGYKRARLLPVLAVALVLAVVAAPAPLRERALSVFDPHHPTVVERRLMWQSGWHMFRDHPVTGVGIQDLRPVYRRYRLPEAREDVPHLHSVPVQVAATMGSVGLLALGLLAGSLFVAAGHGLRAQLRGGGLGAGLRLGALAGLAGFFAAGLFEWNFGDEELLYQLYALAGLAWAARTWDGAQAPLAAAPGAEARA